MAQDSSKGGNPKVPPSDISDDEDGWDNDDFQPTLIQATEQIHTLSPIHETNLPPIQHEMPNIEGIALHQGPEDHEVEINYPSGIIPRVDVKAFRTRSGSKTSHTGTRIIPGQTIQGSRKYISKTILANDVLKSLANIWKHQEYIELSCKWKTSESQVLGFIKNKGTFQFNEYNFSISKTLEALEKTKTYILTQRTISEKISIKIGTIVVEDLLYTVYKSIIYCIKYYLTDIFVMVSFLKLLRVRDKITLQYLNENF